MRHLIVKEPRKRGGSRAVGELPPADRGRGPPTTAEAIAPRIRLPSANVSMAGVISLVKAALKNPVANFPPCNRLAVPPTSPCASTRCGV